MAETGPPGPHEGPEPEGPPVLFALPSEELPPGAAAFLEMANEADTGTLPGAAPGAPEGPAGGAEDDPAQGSWLPHLGPALHVVGEPEPGAPGTESGEDPNVRIFLEMVDEATARKETVRFLPTHDEGGDEPQGPVPGWLQSFIEERLHGGEEGSDGTEGVLKAVHEAIRHVNQSDEISEELRSRLLDLFTDFSVRRPWKDEERPESKRVRRLVERARDDDASAE